jgi:hypothetical protein
MDYAWVFRAHEKSCFDYADFMQLVVRLSVGVAKSSFFLRPLPEPARSIASCCVSEAFN